MAAGPLLGDMSEYEHRAWQRVRRELEKKRERRSLVPAKARRAVELTGDRIKGTWDRVPGSDSFEGTLAKALSGLKRLLFDPALRSVNEDRVLRAYHRAGFPVSDLSDVRKLDLKDVDEVTPGLDFRYSLVSAFQGAAAGLALTGEELLTAAAEIPTAGTATGPGLATIVGTMAADAVGTLAASVRVVAHTAAYYGYPVCGPEDELFALGVLNFSSAGTQAAKTKAFRDLAVLAKLTAKGAPWADLNKFAATQIIRKVYSQLVERLTKRKLATALPVLGILIGAGLNAEGVHRVADRADLVYRTRFLADKYGLDMFTLLPVVHDEPSDDDVIDIEALLEDETDDGDDGAGAAGK